LKKFEYPQLSLQWLRFHAGKISGTRFGAILSGKKNRLIYELMDEKLNGVMANDGIITDDMQYGIDNQSLALELYEERTGIELTEGITLQSDVDEIHMASSDGLSMDETIVQEVKCTQNGYIHLERIYEGVDQKYIAQCINYFAVEPTIKEVHFISYCGFRPERPLHIVKLYRYMFTNEIEKGLRGVRKMQTELNELLEKHSF
jgi:predicted phage-related endonuclease